MKTDDKTIRRLRFHGDNIVECDRCLELITEAYSAKARLLPSDPYRPAFAVEKDDRILFFVDLIPGHGRWQIDLQQVIRDHGAPLREATDVLLTQVSPDGKTELIIAALEFCSALPAGNNAWQRNGRALACATVGIPYLYFAEVGGVELDAGRVVKAPRFPNPIVPFSYLTASQAYRVLCLPVYAPSSSSTPQITAQFGSTFGVDIGRELLRAIVDGEPQADKETELTRRALLAVEVLSAQRVSTDTLRGEEWRRLLEQSGVQNRARWLERRNMAWVRKVSEKVRVSDSFPRLVRLFESGSAIAVGARGIPICLIPQARVVELGRNLGALYGDALAHDFRNWLSTAKWPLVIVWITGFKPRGDDSRPDRGLVPLARMLFGSEAKILSIVSGPGKPEMWRAFQRDAASLAKSNGLWEAVFNLSDAILADSATLRPNPLAMLTNRSTVVRRTIAAFPAVDSTIAFSEHDVDSALHLLFTRCAGQNVFEVMCNPPGGDWSGCTLQDFATGAEYRWTSLPRVSGKGGKRPDHVVQIALQRGLTVLVAIESKDAAGKLEDKVGRRMKKYLSDLMRKPPVTSRTANGNWSLHSGEARVPISEIVSVGAYCWDGLVKLEKSLIDAELDAALAFDFSSGKQATLLHIKASANAGFLVPVIQDAAKHFGGRLKVQVH